MLVNDVATWEGQREEKSNAEQRSAGQEGGARPVYHPVGEQEKGSKEGKNG